MMFRFLSILFLSLGLVLSNVVAQTATSGAAREARLKQWQPEIEAFAKADNQKIPAKNGMLFTGSSSVRLWQTLAADFPQVEIINRGIGGSHIEDVTYFADKIITPYRPRLVVIYGGDNDIASGKTPAQVLEDYKIFVSRVRQRLPNARIAFISIKPSPSRVQFLPAISQANGLIKSYSASALKLDYIDVFTPMLDANGAPREELFLADRLHLNRQGYELWRRVVAPYIKR